MTNATRADSQSMKRRKRQRFMFRGCRVPAVMTLIAMSRSNALGSDKSKFRSLGPERAKFAFVAP